MTRGVTVVCFVFCAVTLFGGCDSANRNRIHKENIAKAELFKRDFDMYVPTGAPLQKADDYLRQTPFKVLRSLGLHDGREFVKELLIEVASGRSPQWYCGHESVGVIAQFNEQQRLTLAYVSSWNFNCP